MFESRQEASAYINQRPVYQNIKHWLDSDTDGTWRIYCNKGIYVNKDQLSNFPKPYKIVLTDYN
jgi:hypothetical protein